MYHCSKKCETKLVFERFPLRDWWEVGFDIGCSPQTQSGVVELRFFKHLPFGPRFRLTVSVRPSSCCPRRPWEYIQNSMVSQRIYIFVLCGTPTTRLWRRHRSSLLLLMGTFGSFLCGLRYLAATIGICWMAGIQADKYFELDRGMQVSRRRFRSWHCCILL